MSNVQYNTLLRHSDAVKLRTKSEIAKPSACVSHLTIIIYKNRIINRSKCLKATIIQTYFERN